MSDPAPPPLDRTDVLIVGAGVAGLYAAWRLLDADPKRRVAVLDLLDRVGGRLDTDLVHIRGLGSFDAERSLVPGPLVAVKEEQGGMRFNQAMTELLALLDTLGMWDRIVPFGMGDGNNWFHVRGRSFTAAESRRNNNAIWAELYDLLPNERNKSPGEIINAVYRDLVMMNGETPPANPTQLFWQQFRLDFKLRGIPLNQWGLWSLLRAFGLSQECISMLADAAGFRGAFFSLVNAGAAYQILEDFPVDPKFFALDEGFSTLPRELARCVEAAGGSIHLGTQVTGIDGLEGGFAVVARQGDVETRVVCRELILAIPPLGLEKLLPVSPALNSDVACVRGLRQTLDAVVPMRMCKVNLYYNHAWWRDQSETRLPQVKHGGSFTSLPMGSVYVFDPLKGEDANGPAALTIYCDHTNTDFWEQLQAIGPMFESPLQNTHNEARPRTLFPASLAVVTEATAQLRDLFRMIAVPRPVLTSFRLWSGEQEFGYAYHQWARFADDRKVIASIARPAEGIYVCNEAFSDEQGWVNGSLRAVDRVLTYFGVAALPATRKTLPGETRGPDVLTTGRQ